MYWAFPWGEGELYGEDGPDTWQREVLLALEEALQQTDGSVRFGVASGNGVGKGALMEIAPQLVQIANGLDDLLLGLRC